MAQIIRCEHGHYYDKDKYKTCPYCEAIQRSSAARGQGGLGSVPPSGGRVWAMDDREDEPTMPFSAMMPKMTNISIGGSAQRREPVDGGSWDDEATTPLNVPFPGPKGQKEQKYRGKAYVTGWIVGLEGDVRGMDFRLTVGMNWLGSSSKADVNLGKGHDIDEARHCAVVYDARGNQFLLFPGSGIATYLNGKVLEKEEILKAGDIITVGSLKFEFVPYCREGHVWKKEGQDQQ